MGFCLFNNIAVAAQWAIANDVASRIAIVDFDVHHGNGTQQIFYSRKDVLYLSSHLYPFYPGSGAFHEQGEAEGKGRREGWGGAGGGVVMAVVGVSRLMLATRGKR